MRTSYTINTVFWLDNIGEQEQSLYLKVLQCMTMGECTMKIENCSLLTFDYYKTVILNCAKL